MNEDELNYYRATIDFNNALDSLSHYGVAGMKWGVRNVDTLRKYNGGGRLSRGITRIKRRFNISRHARAGRAYQEKLIQKQEKIEKKSSPELEEIAKIKDSGGYKTNESNPNKLTDQELRSANQRLQDEITYKQRQAQLRDLNMTKRERRIKNIKSNAADVGKTVLKNFATVNLTKALNNLGGSSNTAKAAKKAKEKVDKATEKTKERIVENVYNVSYNTQINSFYPSTATSSKPKNVSSTVYDTDKSTTIPLASGEDKKK